MSARRGARDRTDLRRPARAAGLLLHPTSLPGRFGSGDLGADAATLLDWLAAAGLSVWQMLPVGPTGYGDSPYNALSAFAGNPWLVSPDALAADGLLTPEELAAAATPEEARIDFAAVRRTRGRLLRSAFERHAARPDHPLHEELRAFADHERRRLWLDDWTLFATIREQQNQRSWLDWPDGLRDRQPAALAEIRSRHAGTVRFHEFVQFLFHRQWEALRAGARSRGVRLLTDLPIYVALDSADVWSHRELFDLEPSGQPRAVAGVPPDYFSQDGQRWGHPLYRWDEMARAGFPWWIARLEHETARADLVRLDHFRGFVAYWRIAAGEATARNGRWVRGPGERLFRALRARLGALPLLAEDLGDVDDRVERLRRRLGLPGMRVLQFAFADEDSLHAPHRHAPDAVVYTGTHDNDTTRGWFAGAGEEERKRALAYLGCEPSRISWAMVRAALTSVAGLAIFPLQDLLDLDSGARMNRPSATRGNWDWRVRHGDVPDDLPRRLRELIAATARLPVTDMVAAPASGASDSAG
ncbi:MAG: 4-alpha-glucanotransferase [Thermoanaerobaculia bacterium]